MLRLRPLGEADRIVVAFSRERGKLSGVAKGARRPRSRFGARLEFFARSRMTLHAGKSLDIITETKTLTNVWERLVDPRTFTLLSYVAEYIDGLCEPDMAVPELYDLLCELQDAIAAGADVKSLIPAVDLRALTALGLTPELDACARCGAALGRRPLAGGRATLSPEAGGLLCRRCVDEEGRSRSGHTVTLSAAALSTLLRMRQLPLAEISSTLDLKIERHEMLGEIQRATRAFVEYHLGRRVRALNAVNSS